MDEETRIRLDKNYKRMRSVERRFPFVRKITQHSKIGPWVPVVAATLEVVAGLFLAGLFAGLIAIIWSYAPWPEFNIPWPNINLPRIPLPHIPWPNIPELPEWAKDTLFWISKTWPIWIAVSFAIYEIKKRKNK